MTYTMGRLCQTVQGLGWVGLGHVWGGVLLPVGCRQHTPLVWRSPPHACFGPVR